MLVYQPQRGDELAERLVATANNSRWVVMVGALLLGGAGSATMAMVLLASPAVALAAGVLGVLLGGLAGFALNGFVALIAEWMAQSLIARAELLRRLDRK